MKLPTISVITPSYNQAQYIEQTIQSVLAQNYPSLEYIIIDGGSTDGSVEIIEKYADRISYWVSEKDEGQSHAINKGLHRATGEIVAWLNSDDYYEDGTLLAAGEAFTNNPSAGVVIGDVINVFPDGRKEVYKNDFEIIDFLNRVSIHQPGVFWRRSLCDAYGYLDKSFYYLMDHELWVRLFFNTQMVRINEPIVNFRIHDQAKTGKNPGGLYLDFRRIISRFFNSFPDKQYRRRMEQLLIYDNPGDIAYNIQRTFTPDELQQILRNNIMNAVVLEYTLGHKVHTSQLVLATLGDGFAMKKLLILLKNSMGLRQLKATGS